MSDQPASATHQAQPAGDDDAAPAGLTGHAGLAAEPAGRPLAAAQQEAALPAPLGVVVEPTGREEIDALLVRLRDADALPTPAHPEVYEDVHRGLREVLAALDTRPGPPPPVPPGHRAAD